KQLGIEGECAWEDAKVWGGLKEGTKVNKGEIIFPRLDIEEELVKLSEANQKLIDSRSVKEVEKKVDEKKIEETLDIEDIVTIDDFDKIKLKIAKVTNCENHPKADRLLVLTLKIGEETRQVVSGIKQWYTAEELIGKKVVVITHLKPVKLRGIESKGMVLAAEDSEGNLSLLSTLDDIQAGATIS
ncbi:MAG: methionine--tRNA ligase subunit beta, partial [Tissierellia bacterium]|nr:methionine--tRNA ligase subunit beta [Tissierellia bacterium]